MILLAPSTRHNERTWMVSAICTKYFVTSGTYVDTADRCSMDVAACNRNRDFVDAGSCASALKRPSYCSTVENMRITGAAISRAVSDSACARQRFRHTFKARTFARSGGGGSSTQSSSRCICGRV